MTDDADKCGPPWIVFVDKGKPLEILAAGRPGVVADVRKLPAKLVERIVMCANARERGFYESVHEVADKIASIQTAIDEQCALRAELERERSRNARLRSNIRTVKTMLAEELGCDCIETPEDGRVATCFPCRARKALEENDG